MNSRMVSVEISDNLVKAVEVDISRGRKRVTAMRSERISSSEPAAVSEAVKSVFRELKPNPQKIQLNIPRHLVTARFLRIPSTDDQEISKMLKIESIKHLPYTDEKVIYGYMITEKMQDGYSLVLLVVAQSGVISSLVGPLKDINIGGLSALSLSSEGLFRWYIAGEKSTQYGNVMLVNLDLDRADIDVIESQRLVFTRGVSYGRSDPGRAGKIASEINVSVNTYQKDPGKKAERIILTGSKSVVEQFYPAIARDSRLPVEVIGQTTGMPIEPAVMHDEDVSFAELLGTALNSEEIKINLMPEETGDESRLIMTKKSLMATLALLGIIAVLVTGLFIKKVHDNGVYFTTINTELKNVESKVAVAKRMMKETALIKQVMSRKPLAIDIVSEICGLTPENISLGTIDYEAGKSVSVRGSAPSLSDAFKYVTVLEKSPYFEGVKVKYANKRSVDSKETVDFEVIAVPTEFK